jgi:protein-L-isoaspartate(D-aspartate) O-methyltransferase
LIAAFSSVECEHYVGKGPWSVLAKSKYISSISDDPRIVYQDILIGLAVERGINNGQPSLHARCLAECAPTLGESAVHIGAGTGYYTAILAALIGPTGKVTAYEIEADLAARARENLHHLANVTVENQSASTTEIPDTDVIYVNAGATHPLPSWLDALNPGGRLIFPLTPNKGLGVMLLVTRKSPDVYAARVIIHVGFVPCIGAQDDATSRALSLAVQSQAIMVTKSLRRGTKPDSTACFVGNGWWLSSTEFGGFRVS